MTQIDADIVNRAFDNAYEFGLRIGADLIVQATQGVAIGKGLIVLNEIGGSACSGTELGVIETFKENKKTIFMTSNDMDLVFNLSDKVGVLMNSSINLEGYPYDIKYSNKQEVRELLSTIKTGKDEEVENEILQLLK